MKGLWTVGVVIALCAAPAISGAESAFGIFVALNQTGPGLRAAKNVYGKTFHIRSTPELDDRDIQTVEFSEKDGSPAIRLAFTKKGTDRFRELTRRHLHERVVFMVRGRVVMVPAIDSVATNDYTWITGNVTKADADAIRSAIGNRGR